MCKQDKCDRHEYDYGYCLPHLKEEWIADGTLVVEEAKPKRKPRKKKTEQDRTAVIDAVDVMTNDDTTEMETRTEND